MALYFFKCDNCNYMFFTGTNLDSKTLICGDGCGGHLMSITEDEAIAQVEKIND